MKDKGQLMTDKTKEASITFRTHNRIKEQVEEIARAQDRSVSWVINRLLMQLLQDAEKVVVERLTETL